VPSAAPAPTTTAAPTCSALLGTLAGDSGSPGAAYEQQQRGAKALVQGKLEDAQLAYCKAALWDAENPQAHIDLAQVLLLRKDGAAAANEARKAIQLDSKSLRAQALLGDALLQTGDVEGAKGALLAAAGVDASDEKALSALVTRALHEAEVSLKKRDPARAERFFRRAAALDPSRFEASRGLSNVLSQLGDAAGAARAAESAIAREPRDPGSLVALGDALFHLGDKAGAEREWREAARLDPSFPDAQRRIKKLRNL
jgi:tetratricopeptide (TPR) repeat protein